MGILSGGGRYSFRIFSIAHEPSISRNALEVKLISVSDTIQMIRLACRWRTFLVAARKKKAMNDQLLRRRKKRMLTSAFAKRSTKVPGALRLTAQA